jgi:hypothetical protein
VAIVSPMSTMPAGTLTAGVRHPQDRSRLLARVGLAGLLAASLLVCISATRSSVVLPTTLRPLPGWLAGPFGGAGASLSLPALIAPGEYLALNAGGEGPPKIHSSFTVTAAPAPVKLPTPQATIRSIEFGFKGPSTLHDGELVAFKKEGWLVHMDLAFPVASQGAAKQVITALKTGKGKSIGKLVTGEPVSFEGPVSHGALQQETSTAKPGWYVQVCFMETQEGVLHTLLGMERAIKITK